MRLGSAFLLLASVVLATVVVILPAAMGWVPLTVVSGSMAPTIPVGSQVIVRPFAGDDRGDRLVLGDVVAFLPKPNDATTVVHRVVAIAQDGAGERSFTTQGDANSAVDPQPITMRELRGVVVYHLPLVGYVAQFLPGQVKATLIYVLVAMLVLYCGYQLNCLRRERRG